MAPGAITPPEGGYVPRAFLRPPELTLARRGRVRLPGGGLDARGTSGRESFPFNNFTCCLTLFPKCFSSFDHSTCALSVSGRCLALEEIYLPFGAAFPNNATRRRRDWLLGPARARAGTGLSPSPAADSTALAPGGRQTRPLQITTRAPHEAGFQIWAVAASLAVTEAIPVGFFSSAD